MREAPPEKQPAGGGSERVVLEWAKTAPVDIARTELLDLHKLLVEEYRFQVKLNSDRTQAYMTLNTAIVTVAAGLIRFGDATARPLIVAICIVGIFIASIAAKAVEKGHRYYRFIVFKKTIVENLLGRQFQISGFAYEGATLALETTHGMAEQRDILQNPKEYFARPLSSTNITGGLIRIFWLFVAVEAFAILYIGGLMFVDRS